MGFLNSFITLSLILASQTVTSPTDPIVPNLSKKLFEKNCPNAVWISVGDQVITKEDIQKKIIPFIPSVRKESNDEQAFLARMDAIIQDLIDKKIDDILIVRDFKSDKRRVIPQSFLYSYYSNYIQANFGGDRRAYNQYLNAQGLTDRQFREQQKEEIIISYMTSQQERSQTETSPERILKYYKDNAHLFQQPEAIRLQQIVIKGTENDDTEQSKLKERGEMIFKELKSGQSFSEVGKKYSEGATQSFNNDLGWVKKEDLKPELSAIAFKLNKGEFSEPIIVDKHLYLFFAEDKKEPGIKPLEEVRNEIEKTLSKEAVMGIRSRYIDRLRNKTYIKYHY